MALNPQYDAIGQAFAQQYYSTFDERNFGTLINFYNVNMNLSIEEKIFFCYFCIMQAETSLMTFEGIQIQGAHNIMEKFNVSTFDVFQNWIGW